jgi:hypothetical protein
MLGNLNNQYLASPFQSHQLLEPMQNRGRCLLVNLNLPSGCNASLILSVHRSQLLLLRCVSDQVIVVKMATNSETATPPVQLDSHNLTNTFNPQLAVFIPRRRNQHFDQNVTSNGWASPAIDESAVHRDILGEAAFRVLSSVIPVKDHWKAQTVADSFSALRLRGSDEGESHTRLRLRETIAAYKTLKVGARGGHAGSFRKAIRGIK